MKVQNVVLVYSMAIFLLLLQFLYYYLSYLNLINDIFIVILLGIEIVIVW